MKLVTFRGTGQLNGVRIINKTIELEDDVVQSLYGPKRYEVIQDIMRAHYPGVKVNSSQIGYQVNKIPKNKNENKNEPKKKGKITFWGIIFWIIKLPFKFMWKVFKEPHV